MNSEGTVDMTPDAIKREYESQLPNIEALSKEELQKEKENILNKAGLLKLQADMFFRSDEIVTKYRKAWAYRISASIYFGLAKQSEDRGEKINLYDKAGEIFHFAGHAFRKEEEYRWAGECYMNSGDSYRECADIKRRNHSEKKEITGSLDNAIRAFRRAKGVFSEVGDYDLSGTAYYREQVLLTKKLLRTNRLRWIVRASWGIFTGYGERFSTWFLAYFVGLVIFSGMYVILGFKLETSILLAGQRSLLIPASGGNALLLIAQTIYSYFILGLGLTIVTRKMQSR